MKKRLLSLIFAAVMLLPLVLSSCSDNSAAQTSDNSSGVTRNTIWLTLYAITDSKTTPQAVAAVQEAVNRLTYLRYKTMLELKFYTSDKYEEALKEADGKFEAIASAAASVSESIDKSKAAVKAAQKTMTAEELRKAKQQERMDAKESVRASRAEEAERIRRINEGIEEPVTVVDPQVDLVFIESFDKLIEMIDDEKLIALDNYLNDKYTIFSDYIQAPVMAGVANAGNGKTYAIPTNSLLTPEGSFMLFKKDLVEKHDIDLSKVVQLSDVTEILKTIKEKEPSIKPVDKPITTLAEVDLFGSGFIGVNNSETEWLNTATAAESYRCSLATSHFRLMGDWRRAGFFTLGAPFSEDAEYEQMIVKAPGDDTADSFMTIRDGSYYDIPKWEEEGYAVVVYKSPEYTTENSLKTFYGISANSKNADRAMEILRMMTTDSQMKNLLQYGIEGTDYSLNENGTVDKLRDDYTMDFYGTGNTFIGYVPEGEDPEYVKQALELSKIAKVNGFLGFDPRFDEETQKLYDQLSETVKGEMEYLCSGITNVNADVRLVNDKLSALTTGEDMDYEALRKEFNNIYEDSLARLISVCGNMLPSRNVKYDFISEKEAADATNTIFIPGAQQPAETSAADASGSAGASADASSAPASTSAAQ